MLAEFAVKRWQFTLVLFVSLCALGVNALFEIPKAEDPSFPVASFVVAAVLPGAAPADLERLVVNPLEAKLGALQDLKTIKAEISDSQAIVLLEFQASVDASRKLDEVQREVDATRPDLPPELIRLEVEQINTANVNIAEFALIAQNVSSEVLERNARALKRRLEAVNGVRSVGLAGLPEREIRVALDLPRMVALGISPIEVLDSISAEGTNVPAGRVESGRRQFSVKTSGDYGSVDEVADTVVRQVDGQSLRVRDVATVELVDAEPTQLARFDGQRAVLVTASQQENRNLFETKQGIEREVRAFIPELAPGISLRSGFDQSENVKHRLSGFGRDFVLAILLVLVTLLPLGTRASLVVMVSIPLSLAMGLFCLKASGFTLNQLSIVGFVIALGLLVDDSVVVVENIARHIREGVAPRDAAIKGTREITASVVGCTATLLFALVPLLLLPGVPGQFIRALPVALLFTIAASLFVSLTVVPFLASRLLRPEAEHGNPVFRVMTRVIEASYAPLLRWALARPYTTLGVTAALLVGVLCLVPSVGFSLFPKAGIPQFAVRVETEDGSRLAETDRAVRFVEKVLASHSQVQNVAASIGKDHPQVYYNVSPKYEKVTIADVFAEAHVSSPRERAALYAELRRELARFPGATLELVEFSNGPAIEAPIALRMLGNDQAELARAAARVERLLSATEGTRDVRNPSSERRMDLRLRIDREKASVLGVRVADVDRAVRLAIGGLSASKYRQQSSDQALDIRVTLPYQPLEDGYRPTIDIFDRLYVASSQRAAVPIGQISELALVPSASGIWHYGKERSVTVTAQVADGYNADRLTDEVLAKLASLELPAGVRLMPGGEVESRRESFNGLGLAILVAVLGVLTVLVLEFRTFRTTLVVASVIPLGVIGGILGLFFTGYTLSFTANIGMVALIGIEVKNSILLVDFTNQLREEGLSLDAAIQRAGEVRFVPILLTTLTAIGGLMPLAFEQSSLYSPLALVILGGLVSSTILTRVVTPVLYKLLAHEPAAEPKLQHAGNVVAMKRTLPGLMPQHLADLRRTTDIFLVDPWRKAVRRSAPPARRGITGERASGRKS